MTHESTWGRLPMVRRCGAWIALLIFALFASIHAAGLEAGLGGLRAG